MKRLICVVALSLFGAVGASGQASDYSRGVAARQQGNYAEAIRHLERAVRNDPQNVEATLALAETLGWMKRFDEAETLYRELLRRNPHLTEARIGVGRLLLWQLELDEARATFDDVLRDTPRDPDALEGAALATWWSGDWRAAERHARLAVQVDPQRDETLRILREIDLLVAPEIRIDGAWIDDDQPYRLLESAATWTFFSDPLTSWTIRGGTYILDHPIRTETSPFASIGGESKFPRFDLGVSANLRFLEFPDGETDLLGSVGFEWEPTLGTLSLSYSKTELLRTRAAIDDHPSVETIELRLSRRENPGWTGSVSVRSLDYYDGNSGIGADAWILSRPFEIGSVLVSAGPAVSYRDTDQSRFLPGFPTGVYDPYWTPEELLEVRGIIDISGSWHNLSIRLHADGGWGEERITPEAVVREFNPWRASISAAIPVSDRWSLSTGVGLETTAFYEATQLTASVARRF